MISIDYIMSIQQRNIARTANLSKHGMALCVLIVSSRISLMKPIARSVTALEMKDGMERPANNVHSQPTISESKACIPY